MFKITLRTALLQFVSAGLGFAQESTNPLEYGLYYGYPPDYSQTGALHLNPHAYAFSLLPADSIKAVHGHFQHVAPARPDDDFPYNELRQLEAQQVAAGGPPILVTCTYAGKRRPVYFRWHLGLDASGHPTNDPRWWGQAVNLWDEAYIQFFANNYVRPRLFQPPLQNYWFGADNCAFWIALYGVLDDNNVFQTVDHFDPPFAQNATEFLDSVVYFLQRLRQVAPDIHIMANEGTMSDETRFAEVWDGFDGISREDITHRFQPGGYARDDVYNCYTRLKITGPAGKKALLGAMIPNDSTFEDNLRTAYVAFLLFRGPNAFFGPQFDDHTNRGIPISSYSQLQAALGTPTAEATDQSYETDHHPGYRFYSRQTSKGMLYLNWSGQELTISLPEDKVWLDRNGRTVTTLTIPDLSGDYVLFN